MSTVKLAGALPPGQANGLAYIAGALVGDPQRYRVVLAVIDVKSVSTDTDTELVIPTVRVKRVMPILDADKPTALRMLERAMEKHSGQAMLPLDLEDDSIASAFTPDYGGSE
jgi:hypothetical protein